MRINMNELIFFEKNEPRSDIKEYTSDGRDKNKFSIIVKPDDRYPNPDETGNGVDTSVENYYNSNVKALQSKSMLNNIQNLLSHIATNINDTYTMCFLFLEWYKKVSKRIFSIISLFLLIFNRSKILKSSEIAPLSTNSASPLELFAISLYSIPEFMSINGLYASFFRSF